MASGERITAQEFESKAHSMMAPTLRIIIPTKSSSSGSFPSFALTLPSPVSPTTTVSPIHPLPLPYTRATYLAAAACAPPSSVVPSLPPLRCRHTLSTSRYCSRCSMQQLACEIWWGSRSSMLSVPQVPAAASTPTTRAMYYALELPFGRLDRACVDRDAVAAISFKRQPASVSRRIYDNSNSSDVGKKSKSVSVALASSRIRVFFHRARNVLSAPSRVPMIPAIKPRRRVNIRPDRN